MGEMDRAWKPMVLIAALLVLLPASAFAKKKGLGPVRTATAVGNVVSGIGAFSTATAVCPRGLHSLGGGFSAPNQQGSEMLIISSYRSSATTWTVEGVSGPGSSSPTAYAYCRRNSHRISDVQSVTPSPPAPSSTFASATCPSKSALIGGGFQSTRGPDPVAFVVPAVNFAPTRKTWTFVASNNGDTPQTVTVHAYCMGGNVSPAFRTASTNSDLTPHSIASVHSPACPARSKNRAAAKRRGASPSAGGFAVPPATSTNQYIVSASTAQPGFWLTTVVGAMGTGQIPVTSQAVCL